MGCLKFTKNIHTTSSSSIYIKNAKFFGNSYFFFKSGQRGGLFVVSLYKTLIVWIILLHSSSYWQKEQTWWFCDTSASVWSPQRSRFLDLRGHILSILSEKGSLSVIDYTKDVILGVSCGVHHFVQKQKSFLANQIFSCLFTF